MADKPSLIKPASFDTRLESLRGVAAFAVAWCHSMTVFAAPSYEFSWVKTLVEWSFIVFPAGGAVIFFFTLSGFVLGESLQRSPFFLQFVVRRLFRILPAFWFSLLLFFITVNYTQPLLNLGNFSDWFKHVYLPAVTFSELLSNILMQANGLYPRVNGVTWSIYPEISCSLVLPLLYFLHKRLYFKWRFVMWLLLFGVSIIKYSPDTKAFFAYFPQYIFCFYTGLFLPREIISSRINGRLTAAFFVCFGTLVIILGSHYGVPYKPVMRLSCAIGAAVVIGSLVASPKTWRWLTSSPISFLGRVSFSFYLLHLSVLYFVIVHISKYPNLFNPSVSVSLLLASVSIILTLFMSYICYKYIELPSIKYGRNLVMNMTNNSWTDWMKENVAQRMEGRFSYATKGFYREQLVRVSKIKDGDL